MTAIVVDWKRVGHNGELKKMVIKTTSAADTNHTYDTDMDASGGRGAEFEEIFNAYHIEEDGSNALTSATWNTSTGIVTLGTVTGGACVVYLVIEGY